MRRKTFKREVACIMLAFILVLALFDILSGGGTAAMKWAELLVTPVFLFAGAAYGADAADKQLGFGKRGHETYPEHPLE